MESKANTESLYKPVIVKYEVNDEHYYMVDDVYFPSVTKILHETLPTPFALRQWLGEVGNEKAQEKMERAADRGTALHSVCERLLIGEEIETYEELANDSDRKVVTGFINWFNERNPKVPMASDVIPGWNAVPTIEFTVASQKQFAGTLDIFCYIDGKPYILDIKTSGGIYDSHFLQITAYQQAFYEMTGIKANRGILHLTPKVKCGLKFYDEKDIKIGDKVVPEDAFDRVYDMYLLLNGGEIPQPPQAPVYPNTLSLFKKEDDEK